MYSDSDVLKEVLVIISMDTVVKEGRSIILPPILKRFKQADNTGNRNVMSDCMFI